MVQLGSRFTLLLVLCLAVAARPATSGIVAEHEASSKHTRRFHRARINKPRYDDGKQHPGYPTATYDEGHFDLIYPTPPHTNEQYAAPSQSPSATQGSASTIYVADGRYHPGYLNATYDDVQVHEGPTTYNNEKYPPQTADQASPSSNSPVVVKTLVVAIAELPTLSTLSATSSPTTTSTSTKPEIPAPTTTTTSAEAAPTRIQKLFAPAAAATTASTTTLSGAVGSAAGILGPLIPTGTPAGTSIVRLVIQTSTTSTTSGGTTVATATSTTPGTAPAAASIVGGFKRPQDDDPMYHVGRSRQKRIDDSQYHTDLRFDNKYRTGKNHEKRFDDGQYLSDPKFEDSQYHPNGNNGEHHGNQELSDDDQYHPSSIYDANDRKYNSGKRNNRRVPVA